MYHIICHKQNFIEIVISETINNEEFAQILDNVIDYSNHVNYGNILFNTTKLRDTYTLKIFLQEFGFYSKFKHCVNRVAFLSSSEHESFMIQEFGTSSDMAIKTFGAQDYREAYHWIATRASLSHVSDTGS
jgi:hypothetical protein